MSASGTNPDRWSADRLKKDSCPPTPASVTGIIPHPEFGRRGEFIMKTRTVIASVAAILFTTVAALCHEEHVGHAGHGQVGNVNFSNSFSAALYAYLEGGAAVCSS